MSDDPASERETDAPSDEESATESRIDDFLERLEETDQSTVEGPEPQQSTPESPDPRQSTSETTDSSAEQPTSRQSKSGGRLWDSFSADRSTDADRDQPLNSSPTETTSQSDEWEPTDTAEPAEWESTNRADSESGGFGAEPPTEEPPKRETDPDESDSDSESSSFRTILKRISHRIGGGSSSDTDSETESNDTPTAGADRTAPSTRSGPNRADSGSAESTRSHSGSVRSRQQDAIDQILNNIDVFGRATSSSQVLLLSPTVHSITNEIYKRFLLPTDGSGQNVLFVSATQSVSDQLEAARAIPNWAEGKTAVIEVGQSGLKPSRQNAGPDLTRQLDIYKTISNLQHLAKLGVNISHIVSQWSDSRRPTVVGVHTLSAIQQYVGNETMFQFLFTLKGQLNSMGVMGFYHMDPSVHTDNEINTITSAFDLVIRVSSDGTVDIE